MKECNKNKILAYHYGEISGRKSIKTGEHIASCKHCAAYLEDLQRIERKLNAWENEKPAPVILENILKSVDSTVSEQAVPTPAVSVKPFMYLAGAILMIIALVYMIKVNIALLPFWESIKDIAFIEFIGPFGVASIIVFCMGFFASFAIAPVLILETQGKVTASI